MPWYYSDQGQQAGPVEDAALDDLVRNGIVRDDTLVWCDGMANWQPYGAVRPKPAAPPPPPPVMTPVGAGAAAAAAPVAFCSYCGRQYPSNQLSFNGAAAICQSCAQSQAQPVYAQPVYAPSAATAPGFAVDPGIRLLGYLIDIIPAVIVGVAIGWIPVLGSIVVGAALFAYWLLRDITGASLGKIVLGTQVVKKDGSPSSTKERILRNVPMIVGPVLMMIPFAGLVIGPSISVLIILVETVLLFTKRERMGDMLAGTTVVKKTG
jgi:uncharacterized RDD family membrane protein YckC